MGPEDNDPSPDWKEITRWMEQEFLPKFTAEIRNAYHRFQWAVFVFLIVLVVGGVAWENRQTTGFAAAIKGLQDIAEKGFAGIRTDVATIGTDVAAIRSDVSGLGGRVTRLETSGGTNQGGAALEAFVLATEPIARGSLGWASVVAVVDKDRKRMTIYEITSIDPDYARVADVLRKIATFPNTQKLKEVFKGTLPDYIDADASYVFWKSAATSEAQLSAALEKATALSVSTSQEPAPTTVLSELIKICPELKKRRDMLKSQ